MSPGRLCNESASSPLSSFSHSLISPFSLPSAQSAKFDISSQSNYVCEGLFWHAFNKAVEQLAPSSAIFGFAIGSSLSDASMFMATSERKNPQMPFPHFSCLSSLSSVGYSVKDHDSQLDQELCLSPSQMALAHRITCCNTLFDLLAMLQLLQTDAVCDIRRLIAEDASDERKMLKGTELDSKTCSKQLQLTEYEKDKQNEQNFLSTAEPSRLKDELQCLENMATLDIKHSSQSNISLLVFLIRSIPKSADIAAQFPEIRKITRRTASHLGLTDLPFDMTAADNTSSATLSSHLAFLYVSYKSSFLLSKAIITTVDFLSHSFGSAASFDLLDNLMSVDKEHQTSASGKQSLPPIASLTSPSSSAFTSFTSISSSSSTTPTTSSSSSFIDKSFQISPPQNLFPSSFQPLLMDIFFSLLDTSFFHFDNLAVYVKTLTNQHSSQIAQLQQGLVSAMNAMALAVDAHNSEASLFASHSTQLLFRDLVLCFTAGEDWLRWLVDKQKAASSLHKSSIYTACSVLDQHQQACTSLPQSQSQSQSPEMESQNLFVPSINSLSGQPLPSQVTSPSREMFSSSFSSSSSFVPMQSQQLFEQNVQERDSLSFSEQNDSFLSKQSSVLSCSPLFLILVLLHRLLSSSSQTMKNKLFTSFFIRPSNPRLLYRHRWTIDDSTTESKSFSQFESKFTSTATALSTEASASSSSSSSSFGSSSFDSERTSKQIALFDASQIEFAVNSSLILFKVSANLLFLIHSLPTSHASSAAPPHVKSQWTNLVTTLFGKEPFLSLSSSSSTAFEHSSSSSSSSTSHQALQSAPSTSSSELSLMNRLKMGASRSALSTRLITTASPQKPLQQSLPQCAAISSLLPSLQTILSSLKWDNALSNFALGEEVDVPVLHPSSPFVSSLPQNLSSFLSLSRLSLSILFIAIQFAKHHSIPSALAVHHFIRFTAASIIFKRQLSASSYKADGKSSTSSHFDTGIQSYTEKVINELLSDNSSLQNIFNFIDDLSSH
ncbi:uncharacterized protein MONOS_13214 [Monocercomonoides exilis]|uniref:uncharacterized protein n=1 Tax=Monocercomonoides exilis TaxID=2049356 RepID=UPI00355AA0C6|nr:hypothetical protein MONOS_13214 [Monocercomonoides exilis]|eukprot:MONOS_13214.1-p1 / transcript=MONOS_13214.1 / gene=MONOS_13214 / organism=Monocercomonoides_exilis_PA203 / gene_product=unspecified product / transcript_product=unspecified product / location=Mono_scaffold00792:8711-11725(+) / protein_length=1005 / sequence_SO=supercontig / SO=protein_coding / is_pseudo=false